MTANPIGRASRALRWSETTIRALALMPWVVRASPKSQAVCKPSDELTGVCPSYLLVGLNSTSTCCDLVELLLAARSALDQGMLLSPHGKAVGTV